MGQIAEASGTGASVWRRRLPSRSNSAAQVRVCRRHGVTPSSIDGGGYPQQMPGYSGPDTMTQRGEHHGARAAVLDQIAALHVAHEQHICIESETEALRRPSRNQQLDHLLHIPTTMRDAADEAIRTQSRRAPTEECGIGRDFDASTPGGRDPRFEAARNVHVRSDEM